MTVEGLLNRFNMVRETGPRRWVARCPAHEDRSPSLSLKLLDDGRWLIHDFGGCDTASILDAVGLKFSDLFPERLKNPKAENGSFKREHNSISPVVVLRLVAREALVCALAGDDAATGKPLTDADTHRAAVAAGRIFAALDAIECRP